MNYKKNSSLPIFKSVSLHYPINVQNKERFKLKHWLTRKIPKFLMIITITAVILISTFVFLPEKNVNHSKVTPKNTDDDPTNPQQDIATAPQTPKEEPIQDSLTSGIQSVMRTIFPKSQGLIGSAQTINSTVWKKVAANAWAFYTPDIGVDPETGLPYAGGSNFRGFTDWDLGSYIQAVIDAQELGLLDTNGTWGSNARFKKVLTFLENRPLNEYGYPFQFYDATTGNELYPESNATTNIADVADTGKLFVALNNLRKLNTALAPRINNIVLNGRSNYTALVDSIATEVNSNSIYAYYICSGFAIFWPQQLGHVPSAILNNILNSQNITTYGVTLPKAALCNEPLLGSVFELENEDSSRLMGLMTQAYRACEARYTSTCKFVAPSEGSNYTSWLYEWVVAPNGEPWGITDASGNFCENTHPVVFTKVAFGFLALYNTDFARNMVVWLEDTLPNPTFGYSDGAGNDGRIYLALSNIANTLILDAARYAIQK